MAGPASRWFCHAGRRENTIANLAAFAWASFVIELTPGPNMTYLAVLTLRHGRRAGLAAVAGVATGLAIA
ncbi:MAG: hypothetical protein K2Y05_12270, partial [Hyphomicrobiaceae bacterium]|nr:hypothetical protein [Hyphomicrobiaceae bacterium]